MVSTTSDEEPYAMAQVSSKPIDSAGLFFLHGMKRRFVTPNDSITGRGERQGGPNTCDSALRCMR